MLRGLAAWGPASAKDLQVWSGLRGLKDVLERLRTRLLTFHDESGRELFDLPDAPRPDEATEAPVRFLGEFDNMLLSYSSYERIIEAEHRKRVMSVNGIVRSTFTADGFVRGQWRIGEDDRVEIEQLAAVNDEAMELERFASSAIATKARPGRRS